MRNCACAAATSAPAAAIGARIPPAGRLAESDRSPPVLQLFEGFLEIHNFLRGFGDAGRELAAFTTPSSDVVLLSGHAALLDRFFLADSAVFVESRQILSVDKFGPTSLPDARLARTTLFHVAPSPVSTSVISSGIVAHLACLVVEVCLKLQEN